MRDQKANEKQKQDNGDGNLIVAKTNNAKGPDQNASQNLCLDSQPEPKPANILLNAKKDAKQPVIGLAEARRLIAEAEMISVSFSDSDKDQFQDQIQDQAKKVKGVKDTNREERKEVLA